MRAAVMRRQLARRQLRAIPQQATRETEPCYSVARQLGASWGNASCAPRRQLARVDIGASWLEIRRVVARRKACKRALFGRVVARRPADRLVVACRAAPARAPRAKISHEAPTPGLIFSGCDARPATRGSLSRGVAESPSQP